MGKSRPQVYHKRRLHWTRVLKWTAIVLVLVIVGLLVWGYVWLKGKEGKMRIPGIAGALDKAESGEPVNTLIVGVDRGSVEGEGGPGRSDIIMLTSTGGREKNAAVVSIPRDSLVPIPGHGTDKINAAHQFGGSELIIDTVRRLTGMPINHYVEIDFEGFKRIVNAMGGVPMHIDVAINDKYAGKVPAGDVVLNGDMALALVRARYDLESVPGGDLDRVKNQRRFMAAMLSTVSRQRNPFTLIRIVNAVAENVKTDLTFLDMFSLGRSLRGMSSGKVKLATAPGQNKNIGGGWYFIIDMPQFEDLLRNLNTGGEPLDTGTGSTTPPDSAGGAEKPGRGEIKVEVLNGTKVSGLAASVSGELKKKGYVVLSSGNAKGAYDRTTVYYADGASAKAGTVAADLPGAREPLMQKNNEVASRYSTDVVVVLGKDYKKS